MSGRPWFELEEVPDGSTALLAVGLSAEERSLFAAFEPDLEAATGVHCRFASSADGGLGRCMALRSRGTPVALLVSSALGDRQAMRFVRSIATPGGLSPVIVLGTRGDEMLFADALAARATDVLLRHELDADRLARAVRFAAEIARRDLAAEAAAAKVKTVDELLEAVWDLVEEGLLVVDGDHRVRRANGAASRLLGVEPETLAATPFGSLPWAIHGSAEGAVLAADEISADVERPAGGRLRVGLKARSLARQAGQSERTRVVAIRSRSEGQGAGLLVDEGRHFIGLGRFLAAVAHDLSNLLTPLLGYCELLVERLPADSPGIGYLREVDRSARLATELVVRLRDVARNQPQIEGTVVPDRNLLDLAGLLRSLVGRGIAVVEELRAGEVEVPLHPGELEQIVLNLAANARDAMPLGGKIALRSRTVAGGRWRLEVEDTGSGIPPENLGRLFDPAFTTKTAGKGTGLGLWIVRTLAEQAGGSVSVASQLGRGTTVALELPIRYPG